MLPTSPSPYEGPGEGLRDSKTQLRGLWFTPPNSPRPCPVSGKWLRARGLLSPTLSSRGGEGDEPHRFVGYGARCAQEFRESVQWPTNGWKQAASSPQPSPPEERESTRWLLKPNYYALGTCSASTQRAA